MKKLDTLSIISAMLAVFIVGSTALCCLYRDQCSKYAQYYVAEKGYALVGHVFFTCIVRDSLDCGRKCMEHNRRCLSINYQHTGTDHHICELSDQVRGTRPDDYQSKPDFTYYETVAGVAGKFGSGCVSSPCQNGGTCIDTCELGEYVCNCTVDFKDKRCQTVAAKNCRQIKDLGENKDGVYTIDPDGSGKMAVYCDQNTDGGGWTVIQRRISPYQTSFNRGWAEYQVGFGNLSGEFWLGNDNIHRLTNSTPVELRIELKAGGGQEGYATYQQFSIASSDDNYRLNIAQYQGTIGNALDGFSHIWHNQNNMPFSTPDRDNDNYQGGNCADTSGWWPNYCGKADLNKPQKPHWVTWSHSSNVIFSEMKIR